VTSLDDALAVTTVPERTAARPSHPSGWEPGIAWDGTAGTLTTAPLDREPDPALWKELIADWDLNPDTVEIVGPVQFRGWDSNVGGGVIKRMRYYRASVQLRESTIDRADVDALIAEIGKRKKRKKVTTVTDTGHSLIVLLSDWQVGKGEADGSAGSVDRIIAALDGLVDRLAEFKRLGRMPETVYLCGLGDLVEGCSGHYAMQSFQTDLDRREQARVVRRLILRYVDTIAALVPRLVCVAVPGNHGENRNASGKAYTTFTDNDDLAVFEQVAEILAANDERYGHCSVMLADSLSTAFDASGAVIGLAHMHQGRSGANPKQKVENWWKGHTMGRGLVGDADILCTGHYHHLLVSEALGRTWVQAPALDPGSAWYEEATGQHSPPGLLTFSVGECHGPRKWDDMKVL
jgi:hypothetical protein